MLVVHPYVIHQAYNGAASCLELFVHLLQYRHLVDTGTAGGAPDVDHGHLVLGKKIFGIHRVAIKIDGLERNVSSLLSTFPFLRGKEFHVTDNLIGVAVLGVAVLSVAVLGLVILISAVLIAAACKNNTGTQRQQNRA